MLLIYLAVINIVTFAAFGMDKQAAVRNKWRTRESTYTADPGVFKPYIQVKKGGSYGIFYKKERG